jgi:hypothetical protein
MGKLTALLLMGAATLAAQYTPPGKPMCSATVTANCVPNAGPDGTVSIGTPSPAINPPAGSINIAGNIYQNGALFTMTRALVFNFDGGGTALATGKTLYLRVPFACTIVDWSIGSTTAETVTVKFWKVASGTALPTVSNVISTAGVSLSTGTAVKSTTVTDFTTTAVAADDWLAATLTAVTASQFVNATLGCRQ